MISGAEIMVKCLEQEGVEIIFSQISMKVWALTILSAVVIYLVIELINRFFLPKNHITIEEAIKNNSQESH